MTGFHQDDAGDWVAELECGHDQHVRHQPPFQVREWVVDDEARRARLGAPLECPMCDRGELPDFEFLTVDRAAAGRLLPVGEDEDQGGDPACWAGLLCPECGAVMDGGPHGRGCPAG